MIDLTAIFSNEHAKNVAVTDGTTVWHVKAFLTVTTLDFSEFGQDTQEVLTMDSSNNPVKADYWLLMDYTGNDIQYIVDNGKRALTPRKRSSLLVDVEIQ